MKDMAEMLEHVQNGVAYLTFPSLDRLPFLRHAFSTRMGGVSEGPYASMNLNFGRGDPDENVRENFHRFCEAAGFDYHSLSASSQDHHTVVRRVGEEHRGLGFSRPKDCASVDGLITDDPAVTLVTSYADCVPLFFADPVHRAVGLAHGGWRGTAAGIARETVLAMGREFGTKPEDVYAAVGPSIGPCCFEVDAPVAESFLALERLAPANFVRDDENGKYHVDLWECNRRIFLESGLLSEHISVGGLCTRCNPEYLYSHRASGGVRGGLAAFMAVRSDSPERNG